MELHQEVGAVRRELVLDAPREDVWALVAEPDGLAGWLADDVELDAVAEGAQGLVREDGEERLVTVEEVERERRVALSWCAPGGSPSLVELTLDDAGEGRTRLVVVELPLVRLAAAARDLAAGPRMAGPQADASPASPVPRRAWPRAAAPRVSPAPGRGLVAA